MMGEKTLKYIFFACSVLLLCFMLYQGKDAGVTCDEVLHYQQSVSVYNYFASHGRDQTALNTPVTHLKYYGQSYDNLSTILIKWFNISDIYGFRHFMSTVAGWLSVLVTALFAIWISGYGTGLIVLFLFALSPTFLGHSQNNLKDIPFALAYTAGLFYTLKFLLSGNRIPNKDAVSLTLSIAFGISIRAGGLLLICNLFLFLFLFYITKYFQEKKVDPMEIRDKLIWSGGIALAGYFLGTILWPYALQNPLMNPFRSLHIMVRFPDTFRQIFEGRVEWSDFMPWNYLPEYMAITIPIIVLAGLVIFICSSGRIFIKGKSFIYSIIILTVIFPVLFVIGEKSNLYSAWRHFLFIYPGIILMSATGYNHLFTSIRNRYVLTGIILLFLFLAIHPFRFMVSNPNYSYIYYNQFIGGLKGAYGNFETDYYYVSLKDGSDWLIKNLKERKIPDTASVAANFSVHWYFRNHPEVKTSYLRFEERSLYDWDYAIIANRYIPPYQLKKRIWPPDDALKIIYVDSVPVCVVLKRKTKMDLLGYEALKEGKVKEAIKFYEQALKFYNRDEMIFYYFAAALYEDGQSEKAVMALKRSLEINPGFDLALMYLGNIAASNGNDNEAINYYEDLISNNRKYFEAYVALSKLYSDKDIMKARTLLRDCLTINPEFLPAIVALADSYRKSSPDIAKKYDELANTIKKN